MKRHFNELKTMVSGINSVTSGEKLVIERSGRNYGAVGFSYDYIIKRWDYSEGGHHKILLNWAGFGEAYGFLKAMVLSLNIQGDIFITPEDAANKIQSAVDKSTANLRNRIKELEEKLRKGANASERKDYSFLNAKIKVMESIIADLHSAVACRDDRIKELEIELNDSNAAITNLKHELISAPKIGEAIVPTRATIAAELKRAWNTIGQTHLFHAWCRILLKEIILGKLTPPPEDNKRFMEYAVAGVDADKVFITMIAQKYLSAIQTQLLRIEEAKI